MDTKLKRKISSLEPKIRRKIEDLFKNMNESISLLYDIATQDEKTGLYNARFFNSHLEIEIEKAKRGKQKLSLMVVDIDHFKKINDEYGHVKADELLFVLAQVIKKQIRKSDIAARFGGEEFFVILPETTLNKARKLCIRLKNAIHSDSVLKKYRVTASMGLTEFKKNDNTKSFKTRADKALYNSKEAGRDRCTFIR